MRDVVAGGDHKSGRPVSASSLICSAATFSASIAAGMLSISFGLSWPESLILTFTAATITFGVVFTIFEMRRMTANRR